MGSLIVSWDLERSMGFLLFKSKTVGRVFLFKVSDLGSDSFGLVVQPSQVEESVRFGGSSIIIISSDFDFPFSLYNLSN